MPSPSSQNLRSAPQKHPMPKIAVSRPSGYGPLSGRPLTKWRAAVAIGSLRPGRAVAALGISSFFLNVNILHLLVDLATDISLGGRFLMRFGSASRFRAGTKAFGAASCTGPAACTPVVCEAGP